ncbi:hypothetical protein NKK52_30385 [Mesorhizobium sp. C277A]|uniref:hypothetical protein n=1 Tax=Mesorhizobium sp. C277A TaxID=2956827 RepID=UPI0003CF7F8E|nr:hypothetical protein [Mesorhizobium sp. LSJC277A00]ESW68296.1 hypothetical protein X771_11385 [Mesorhizobium sp. LSJC277A00]
MVPNERTERLRRLVARRNHVVRHRTRVKNEVHGILQAHLVPKCPHADLFNNCGRAWLERQVLPDDERAAIARHIREIDRLAEDLAHVDRDIARDAIDDPQVGWLQTITGVNAVVAILRMIRRDGRISAPRPRPAASDGVKAGKSARDTDRKAGRCLFLLVRYADDSMILVSGTQEGPNGRNPLWRHTCTGPKASSCHR